MARPVTDPSLFRIKSGLAAADTKSMDIDEFRIHEVKTQPATGSMGFRVSDATQSADTAAREVRFPSFRMPTAEAIAEAIIRRTLVDLRG